MEDQLIVVNGEKKFSNCVDFCSKISSDCEPQRKKRCLRFPSDLSSEDALSVGDSGFGELSTNCKSEENGGAQPTSFLHVVAQDVASIVFDEDSNKPSSSATTVPFRTTSVDTISSVQTEDGVTDLSYHDDEEESKLVKSTSSTEPEPDVSIESPNFSNNSSVSDPACSSVDSSRSSSATGNHNSDDCDDLDDQTLEEFLLSNKEITSSPSKFLMMQRFLAHFKNNPHDPHLQHFLSLLLCGPEYSPPRSRLRHITTVTDAARLLRCSKKILVLTGAGISVSCGIPDFRSKDGLYSRVSKVFPQLRDPQSVFDIRLFKRDPRPFFLTAKEIYPGQFEPSLSHKFIKKLESRGQLLRNYSQNIDTLETIAGIKNVTMCHGSFATATCIRCKHKVEADAIKDKVLTGDVAFCWKCSTPEELERIKFPLEAPSSQSVPMSSQNSNDSDDEDMYPLPDPPVLPPVLKPDIVFFGEDLPEEFHNNLTLDKTECDLLLVIGSSLRVRPVSLIPGMLPPEVPQILINRESLPHCHFDVELLGNCDGILSALSREMGYDFKEFVTEPELRFVEKLPHGYFDVNEPRHVEDPKSEHDIQALKACWEPKVSENLTERLPENSYCMWRPRKYIFEGAEVNYDPADDEDSDDDSCSSSSDDSSSSQDPSSNENIENFTATQETDLNPIQPVTAEIGKKDEHTSNENITQSHQKIQNQESTNNDAKNV